MERHPIAANIHGHGHRNVVRKREEHFHRKKKHKTTNGVSLQPLTRGVCVHRQAMPTAVNAPLLHILSQSSVKTKNRKQPQNSFVSVHKTWGRCMISLCYLQTVDLKCLFLNNWTLSLKPPKIRSWNLGHKKMV